MEFQNRLYELRKKAGLSQEGLADLLGVTRQAVSKWELDDALPDTDKLVPLARALGVSVDELLAMGGENAEAVLTHRFTDSSLTVG